MEVGEPSGFSSVSRRRTAVERSSKVSRQAAEEETLTGGRKEGEDQKEREANGREEEAGRTGESLEHARAGLDVHHALAEGGRVVDVSEG